MNKVRRVYVEKKREYAVKADELRHEIKHYLGVPGVTGVRQLVRYDVENISYMDFPAVINAINVNYANIV